MTFIRVETIDTSDVVIVNTHHIVSIHAKSYDDRQWYEVSMLGDVRHRIKETEFKRIESLLFGENAIPEPVLPANIVAAHRKCLLGRKQESELVYESDDELVEMLNTIILQPDFTEEELDS